MTESATPMPLSNDDLSLAVREVISETLQKDRLRLVGEDDSLIRTGLIDSLEIVSIAVALELRFSVKVPDQSVTVDNFDSISRLAALVRRLRGEDEIQTTVDVPSDIVQIMVGYFRRPMLIVAGIAIFLVLFDIVLDHLISGPFSWAYENFNEDSQRLYPISGNFAQDDFSFAVSKHEIVTTWKEQSPRVAVFGNSGTIGSYVKAEDSLSAFAEQHLKKLYPKASVYNLAYFIGDFRKDVSILEAVIEQTTGNNELPFDVVVFSGLEFNTLTESVPHVSLNLDLFERYLGRLPEDDQFRSGPLLQSLQKDRELSWPPFQQWHRLNTANAHYRPFLMDLVSAQYSIQREWDLSVGVKPYAKADAPPPANVENTFAHQKRALLDNSLLALVEATVRLLQSHGAKVILMPQPVAPKSWRRLPRKDEYSLTEIAQQICDRTGCQLLNASWVLQANQFTDNFTHYTVDGNRLLGELLADQVDRVLTTR